MQSRDDDAPDGSTVLRTRRDVERYRGRVGFFTTPRAPTIGLVGLSRREADAVEGRLRRHATDCGCGDGAIAVAVAMAVSVLGLALLRGWPSAWRPRDLVIAAAAVGSAALLGKVIGIGRARFRLLRELDRLDRVLDGRQTTEAGG